MPFDFPRITSAAPSSLITKPDFKMKNVLVRNVACSLLALVCFGGCVAKIGNRDDAHRGGVTLGQQLMDLQKAKDSGAITEAEFQAEKAKFLGK